MENIKIGNIKIKTNLYLGSIKSGTKNIYPELEDLEVTPTVEEQNFKSSKYGYDNVKVKAIETEEIIIAPTLEDQVKEGIFNKVTVNAIETEELNVTSSLEKQTYEGLYGKVNIEGVVTEELNVIPSKEKQVKEGIYSKVTVAGDDDLIPDNIKKGVNVFGVEGTLDGIDTSDGTVEAKDILEGKVAYARGEKIVGILQGGNTTMDISGKTYFDYNVYLKDYITEINGVDATSITSFNYAFSMVKTLKKISFINTHNVTNYSYAFKQCTVETLSELNGEKATNVTSMFQQCCELQNYGGLKDLGKGYTQKTANYTDYKHMVNQCEKLTHESLMNIINNLYDLNLTYDVANGGTLYTQSLYLGDKNKAKLTPEEMAIATNKGWTLA